MEALKQKYKAEIAVAKANLDVLMHKAVGIGEHSDITEAIQCELDKIARYEDQLNVLDKYFK